MSVSSSSPPLRDGQGAAVEGPTSAAVSRQLRDIEWDIAALDERRRQLLEEHKAALRKRTLRILAMFDDENASVARIAAEVGMNRETLRIFLFNRGRTVQGRNAMQAQLASLQPCRAQVRK